MGRFASSDAVVLMGSLQLRGLDSAHSDGSAGIPPQVTSFNFPLYWFPATNWREHSNFPISVARLLRKKSISQCVKMSSDTFGGGSIKIITLLEGKCCFSSIAISSPDKVRA